MRAAKALRYATLTSLALAALAGTSVSTSSYASADVAVSPPRIDVAAGVRTGNVRLVNRSDTATLVFDAEVFRWMQGPNGDDLQPTREVIANPLVVTIPPNSEQVVRVGFLNPRTATAAEAEKQFRLVLTQRSSPTTSAEAANGRAGNAEARTTIATRARMILPVFFAATSTATAASPSLAWRVRESGPPQIGVVNSGVHSFKIDSVSFAADPLQRKIPVGRYVFPGGIMALEAIPSSVPLQAGAKVELHTDQGAFQLEIPPT